MTGSDIISHHSLTALIDRATARLYSARNAAEVIDAYELAKEGYAQARRARAMAKAKQANDDLMADIHQIEGDAQIIKAQAQARLADEYDAAQARGEVAKVGEQDRARDNISSKNIIPATVAELGLNSFAIHEARQIRDAEQADPGVIERTIRQAVAEGREPTSVSIQKAARSALNRSSAPSAEERLQAKQMKRLDGLIKFKELWREMTIHAKRDALHSIGLTDTAAIEKAIRVDFKTRQFRKRGSADLTLPPLSSLPKLDVKGLNA